MAYKFEQLWDLPLDPVASLQSDEEKAGKRIHHAVGNIVWFIVFVAFKIAFRYRVVGRENLRQFDGKGGCVVVGNHSSYLDPAFQWVSARTKQWIRFMARDNMFYNANGLAGWVISRVGAFPVKRDEADRSAIKRAAAMLKRGEVVGIYPEGTRRGKGTVPPSLHAGAAFIARMGKAPIVPSSIRNIEKIKQKGERVHFPKVTVVYGEAVYLEDFDFIPKAERLDAMSWYVMRECYALYQDIDREHVDMQALFPEVKDYSATFAGMSLGRAAA